MTESASPAGRAALDDPFARLTGALAGATRMTLELVDSVDLSPGMRRLTFTAPELAALRHQPGQDMMLMVAVDRNRPVRRRYTIRALDRAAGTVTADVVRHGGDGPGERWIAGARLGDRIEGIAPRGKISLSEQADWHLFAGDQSALPAFAAMAEALPAGTRALMVVEVPGRDEEQDIASAANIDVVWLHRGDRAAGDPAALAAELAGMGLAGIERGGEKQDGGGAHAYLAGEARAVLALRQVLCARGFAPEQVSPKAYWGRGRANASHGEPAKDG